MLHLFVGPGGSGKTSRIKELIRQDVDNGKTVFLIVPEQSALDMEAEFTELLPPSAQLSFEVLNFTRLANRVFRRYGGISYKYLTRGMKSCLMWRTLGEIGRLSFWDATPGDGAFIDMMISASDELKMNGVSPESLSEAAEYASPRLAQKLRDLADITSVYDGLLKEGHSDPSDDVGKLAKILKEQDFFSGSHVYIDSFTDFTAQQQSVLDSIIAQAEDVTVSITSDKGALADHAGTALQYKLTYRTAAQLRASARRSGIKVEEVFFEENLRAKNEELKHVSKNIWVTAPPSVAGIPEHIKILECTDPYSEAERVASDICRRVLEDGIRYREIAVIARDISSYSGIIDAVFDKYQIPYFMSKQSEVMAKPLIKMIFCALSVIRFGWKREDVLTYVKTGLAGITPDECDELSLYCEKWNISGSGFYGELDWSMNPEGLKEEFSDRSIELLQRLNSVKERLRTPLLTLSEAFTGEATVHSVCRALFEFLELTETKDRLTEYIDAAKEDGRLADAAESAQLWNIVIDSLDRLSSICGKSRVTVAEFSTLLTLLFSETTVGAIPTSADPVMIGSASALRASGVKVAYLIGCERGVFPAEVSETSIFSDEEKVELETNGIVISARTEDKLASELFYFSRAATLPSDDLIFSYSTGSASEGPAQSPAIDNLVKLFPDIEKQKSVPVLDLLYSKEEMRDIFSSLSKDDPLSVAIKETLADDPAIGALSSEYPLVLDECAVSRETSDKIFGKDLHLTQSRLENFVMCKFSYYCNYVLGIQASRDVFDYADIGTFMHAILEQAFNDEDSLEEIVSSYIRKICPREKLESARVAELFGRLKRTAALLLKELRDEFEQSDFTPEFFEYKIGLSEKEHDLSFDLPDGGKVSLSGIADRVDTYVKDGRAYIRVVDYKTGKKEFSLADIADGINLQLLLYLFAIWKSPGTRLKEKLGASEVLPAGILYFEARPPEITLESTDDTSDLSEREQCEISRSGLLISDPDILRAMDKEMKGRYIPVKLKSDGVSFASEKSLASLEKFGQLFREVSDTIVKIGTEMKSGAADARPKTEFSNYKNKVRCAYCDMYPICRRDRNV